jgi:hypothetical protein
MAKQNLESNIANVVNAAFAESNAAVSRDDFPEAKRVLTEAVRDLRDYKRQLTESERDVRASYQDARLKTRSSGQTIGLFVNSKTRAVMSRARAAEGRSLTGKQAEALRPYASAKLAVDRAIAAVDREKARVAEEATRRGPAPKVSPAPKAAATPVTPDPVAQAERVEVIPPPPMPPAAWVADPTGRHEHRYWNGAAWTEHVADRGVASIDPM